MGHLLGGLARPMALWSAVAGGGHAGNISAGIVGDVDGVETKRATGLVNGALRDELGAFDAGEILDGVADRDRRLLIDIACDGD